MKSPKSLKKLKTEHLIFSISLLIFLSALVFYFLFKNNLFSSKNNLSGPNFSSSGSNQQAQASPTPTPKPLPIGKQIYRFSHGSLVEGPKPTTVTIDPIDPNIGDSQTFLVEIEHTTSVSKAIAILITDNQEVEYSLTLIEGDKNKGIWTTKWKMEDSYDYTYQINLVIHDTTEIYSGGLVFR